MLHWLVGITTLATLQGGPEADCTHVPPSTAPAAAINDNRKPPASFATVRSSSDWSRN
jgi:hypothetical protein